MGLDLQGNQLVLVLLEQGWDWPAQGGKVSAKCGLRERRSLMGRLFWPCRDVWLWINFF